MKYVPTEKQNRNMKTKVLKYKFDGNTIVAPYMELEPYAENVFILKVRKEQVAGHYISSNDKQTVSIRYFGNSFFFKCSTFPASSSGLKFFFCRFTSAATA